MDMCGGCCEADNELSLSGDIRINKFPINGPSPVVARHQSNSRSCSMYAFAKLPRKGLEKKGAKLSP